jgi:hypothetical protein
VLQLQAIASVVIIITDKINLLVACKATFLRGANMMLSKRFLTQLQNYLDRHLSTDKISVCEEHAIRKSIAYSTELKDEMDNFIKNKKKPSFYSLLSQYIDQKGLNDAEIYKKAGIDRRHFSKIRSNSDYHPGKNTVVALCLALELTRKETDMLLASAGFTLSNSEIFDLIISFCLEQKIYNIDNVNLALDYYRQKSL